ncbi:MAG: carbohydrate ABC transporter permease [Betaproteobacteria bacterium]
MRTLKRRLWQWAKQLVFCAMLAVILFVFLFPIVWTISTSFKHEMDAFAVPPKLIFRPTLENYQQVLQKANFLTYAGNSLVVGASSTALAMAIGLPAAYAMSRFSFRRRRDLAGYILSTRVAPPILVAFPFFMLFSRLGLVDTRLGLTLVYVAMNLSFVVWLMAGFFRDIPREIDEAAMMDGCSRFQAFIHVILPITASGISATAVFTFIMAWNEFFFALVLTSETAKTLPVALTSFFVNFQGTMWGELCAAASLIMLPMLVFGFLMQRRLARGLTMGAIK